MLFLGFLILLLSGFRCSSDDFNFDLPEKEWNKYLTDTTFSFNRDIFIFPDTAEDSYSLLNSGILLDDKFNGNSFKDSFNEGEEKCSESLDNSENSSTCHSDERKVEENVSLPIEKDKGNDFSSEAPRILLNDATSNESSVPRSAYDPITKSNPNIREYKSIMKNSKSSKYKKYFNDIKRDLNEKILEQHPLHSTASMRKFEIQNWPKEVDPFAQYWTKEEIEMIRPRLNDLIFIRRSETKNKETFVNVPCTINLAQVFDDLLMRFKSESGFHNAKKINWEIMDPSQLPDKYKNIEPKRIAMKSAIAAGSPGLVENIHFYRYAAFYLSILEDSLQNLGDSSKRFSANDYMNSCRMELFEKFKRESRHASATHIEWLQIDSSRLPAKYRGMKLSNFIVFEYGLYKDPEFFENVHFNEYSAKRLKALFHLNRGRKAILNKKTDTKFTESLASFSSEYSDDFERENKRHKLEN